MVPLWQRPKSEVTAEEYNQFYKEKYGDWEDPLSVVHVSAEGAVEYKAMLYIPAHAPYDFHSREYQKGLQLYSSGVLIMDKCADLLPEHFRFVKGVVDSQDFSLNISREMLQHTRQLKVIAGNLEKKIKADLLRLQKDDREKYETFWKAFGTQIKVGVVSDYGAHKELLKDLLLFFSSKEGKLTSLAEYKARMPVEQKYIYYAAARTPGSLPSCPRPSASGTRATRSSTSPRSRISSSSTPWARWTRWPSSRWTTPTPSPRPTRRRPPWSRRPRRASPCWTSSRRPLGDAIKEARVSKILKSGAVCLTADGPITLEMEKYFQRVDPENAKSMKAQRVLELNPDSAAFAALSRAVESDRDKAARYAKLLYAQAQLIAGLPLEDPAGYTELVCSLMN